MTTAADTVRPGRPKSGQKAQAILYAAGELFLSNGYQGTSMDAVAQRAGVSKQTVYSHFANKEELFKACIRGKVAGYGFDGTASDEHGDLRDALSSIARQFVELMFDPEVIAMHRVVMAEAASQPRIAELFFDSGPKRTKAAVCEFLQRQVEAGRLQISPDRLLYAAVQLLNTAAGMYQLSLWLGLQHPVDRTELDAHLERVVDDFLALYGVGATTVDASV
ncbi:MAG: TetR/AcrR family transcriptional regulator [Gammaproteobacteria bacterium]|nr:TetR/AcrR family transcriptional regulator [Gammaproteobacteria bacterium]